MLCYNCNLDKNKIFFSKSQLKKKSSERKCFDCCNLKLFDFSLDKQKILFRELIKWLKKNGGRFPNLEIKHYNKNFRGIVVNKSITKNKIILSVPHKCIMTTLKAKESDIGKYLSSSGYIPYSNHTWLALFLLQERNRKRSFWSDYINVLPPFYSDFPQFYNNKELEGLKGSFVLDMIRARNLSLEKEFNKLKKFIPEFINKISLQDYIWARIVVISRVFQIKFKESKTEGLVPMADMLNHSENPGTKWSFIPDNDSFMIISDSLLLRNSEVFDTYGPKCNSRYLVNYGFTLKNNDKNNQCVLFINPEKILDDIECPLKNEKLKLFENNYYSVDDSYSEYKFLINEKKEILVSNKKHFRFQFKKLTNEKISLKNKDFTGLHSLWCLFGFLRLIVSSKKDFFDTINSLNSLKKIKFIDILLNIKPQSIETEILVLKYLSIYCEKSLDKFPSLVEEDEKELENIEPYTNRWNILNMIIGEKKVLLHYRKLGIYVNKIWTDTKCVSKITRYLRKNKEFTSYYKVYWEKYI